MGEQLALVVKILTDFSVALRPVLPALMITTAEKIAYLKQNKHAPVSFFVLDSPATEPAPGSALIACEQCGDLHHFAPRQLVRAEQHMEKMGGVVLVICRDCAASEGVSATSATPTLIGYLNDDGKITP